jgi:hypothetical protein
MRCVEVSQQSIFKCALSELDRERCDRCGITARRTHTREIRGNGVEIGREFRDGFDNHDRCLDRRRRVIRLRGFDERVDCRGEHGSLCARVGEDLQEGRVRCDTHRRIQPKFDKQPRQILWVE